ncbi:MAG TPA: cobyrinate a,c-diamide synthase [Bauldia sp.]|nr:cobyrinate a,c-diamide synthase [Bauldia sp.]
MTARVLMIAGAASGTGKTTVTAGLIAALRRRGLIVHPVKAGPDYIDAAFHAVAAGAACRNLDSWAMDARLLETVIAEAGEGADIVLIEAAMGLFDGLPGPKGARGAAADLAAKFGIPVALVLDVGGQAQTSAAVARGLAAHDPAVHVAGVILNRVAGDRHRDFIAEAMAAVPVRVFGALARSGAWALPSRHLGLVQAGEHPDLADRLGCLAEALEAGVDLDAVLAAAESIGGGGPRRIALPPPGKRIALADDAAFSFIYQHMLDGWRSAGTSVTRFSPLADEPVPADADCVWLPGGYPELHAAGLSAARRFRDSIVAFAETRPVHGECGGYMVLGAWLEDAEGTRHPMVNLLGHCTSFRQKKLTLGYREATLRAASPLGPAGGAVRGHEFHYSRLVEPGSDEPLAELADGRGASLGPAGSRRGNVSGTWFHAIATA